MSYFHLEAVPSLRSPVLIAAFLGWNDAAQAATTAVQHLISHYDAQKFADLDPEEFYDFTEARPRVSLDAEGQRHLTWPANEFYFAEVPHLAHDLVFFLGIEPHLKWRTYMDAFIAVARRCGVATVLMLGALVADVPHARPVHLTGSSHDAELRQRLRDLRVKPSRYEGPTGIVGALGDACRRAALPAASMWGNVPHYISATPNPKVTHALLARLSSLLGLDLDLSDLARASAQFDAQVTEAVRRTPTVASYVRELERRFNAEGEETEPASSELPSAESLIQDLEQFLRRRRAAEDDG
jgi:proteasome assembly chaperone (PAC2) family protein